MAGWYRFLACPNCRQVLAREGQALCCASGHSFDIAREGYVNLLSGGAQTGTADTTDMVAARATFLAGGHFAPLADAVARAVERAVEGGAGCVVDVGAGTGTYLAAALDRLAGYTGLALDLSKHAARRAARAHQRMGAVVCDAWGTLPVQDSVAAAVLCVFAPRNGAEFARILRPGGAVVVAVPTTRHLQELVGPLGMVSVDPRKTERLEAELAGHFVREDEEMVESTLQLSHQDALAVVRMGPSAHHASLGESERLASALPEPALATLSARVSTWRLRER